MSQILAETSRWYPPCYFFEISHAKNRPSTKYTSRIGKCALTGQRRLPLISAHARWGGKIAWRAKRASAKELRTYDLSDFHGCFLSSEKPTVTMSSKPPPSLVEGERLTLTCQANEATKEIRWTKDDVPVTIRANIYPTGNNSTLVTEKVLTSDSGKYSCKAVNKAGSASSSVDIRVTGNKDSEYNIYLLFY